MNLDPPEPSGAQPACPGGSGPGKCLSVCSGGVHVEMRVQCAAPPGNGAFLDPHTQHLHMFISVF